MYKKYIGNAFFFFLLLLIPAEAWGAQKIIKSLRASLMESSSVKALYAIDGTTTFVEAGEGFIESLEKFCTKKGLRPELSESGIDCRGYFSAHRSAFDQKEAYIIKSAFLEPFIYKTEALPSYEDLGQEDAVSIDTLTGAPLYQYMYGLCKKKNGEPAFVVQRRYGRFTRLTKVSPAEAFSDMTSSPASSWFFGCEGRRKFAVERVFEQTSGPSTRFFSGRTLEGIDYVRGDDAQTIAALKAYGERETADPDFLENMVWEIASLQMGFVRTTAGARFEGSYRGKGDCGVVTIKEIERDGASTAPARSYSYKVCNGERASLVSRR